MTGFAADLGLAVASRGPQDATLKRCFGIDRKIADCDWAYLRTLKTVRQPAQAMPRLADLLVWLARPGLEAVWVLLDIKVSGASFLAPA